MSSNSHVISSESLISVRNNLAHIYRFGGVCSALKFSPSNISSLESKTVSSNIINSLNEHFWNIGIDIISTNYNNGGSGFMFVSTTENKDAIKSLLADLQISKSLKNEYVVNANDILTIAGKSSDELNNVSFIMTIYDSYKINTQNQFALSLNEDANTSADVQICERSIHNHLRNLGLVNKDTDQGLLDLLSEFAGKFADQSKKYVVPALVVVALFYALYYVWNQYQALKAERDVAINARSIDLPTDADLLEENAAPAEPAEPAGPSEPSDFDVSLMPRSVGNQRISSLLRTLEDSEVKQVKANNIEAKILSLLAETTSSN